MSHTFNHRTRQPADTTKPHLRHVRYSHKEQTWQVQDKLDRKKWKPVKDVMVFAYRAIGFGQLDDELPDDTNATALRFSHRFNAWQVRMGDAWIDIDVTAARSFYDGGLDVGVQG